MDAMCATTFSTDANAQTATDKETAIVKRTKEALGINPFKNPLVLLIRKYLKNFVFVILSIFPLFSLMDWPIITWSVVRTNLLAL